MAEKPVTYPVVPDEKTRTKIAAATVRFPEGGQGVIVPGHLIVTAAHVLTAAWSSDGRMAGPLGDHMFETVLVGDRTIHAEVVAVEPVADIAVLGVPDGQTFPEEADAFEEGVAPIDPVRICTADFPVTEPFRVHLFNHKGRWVTAQATQYGVNASSLSFVGASEGIVGGTSGSPVVTDGGRLIGVVSTAGGPVGTTETGGSFPRLHITAPGWLVRRKRDPEWEMRKTREIIAARGRTAAGGRP